MTEGRKEGKSTEDAIYIRISEIYEALDKKLPAL